MSQDRQIPSGTSQVRGPLRTDTAPGSERNVHPHGNSHLWDSLDPSPGADAPSTLAALEGSLWSLWQP